MSYETFPTKKDDLPSPGAHFIKITALSFLRKLTKAISNRLNRFQTGSTVSSFTELHKNDSRRQTKLAILWPFLLRRLNAWRRSGVFIVNLEHISHLAVVFVLLILNM